MLLLLQQLVEQQLLLLFPASVDSSLDAFSPALDACCSTTFLDDAIAPFSANQACGHPVLIIQVLQD